MDLTFSCPNCHQEMVVDASGAGSDVECPACGEDVTIPEPDPQSVHVGNPIARSAAAREERHYKVPVHDKPTEMLIEKPRPPLEATKDGDKKLKIKCIKRTECVEVGKDHFDEVVSEFLNKVGQNNIISLQPLTYTHLDMGTRQLLTDYGIMIVYKG